MIVGLKLLTTGTKRDNGAMCTGNWFNISSNGDRRSNTYMQAPFNPKQAGGGGVGRIRPQAGSSLCCAKTVCSKKVKLCDFYYILIALIVNTNQSHGASTVAMAMLLLKSAWYNFG